MATPGGCAAGCLLACPTRPAYPERGRVAQLLPGGSWNNNAGNCRSAYRNHNQPGNANNNVGFRVLPPPAPFTVRTAGRDFRGCT
jgi:formylglycine-generating enzyme required for sulfatase activity